VVVEAEVKEEQGKAPFGVTGECAQKVIGGADIVGDVRLKESNAGKIQPPLLRINVPAIMKRLSGFGALHFNNPVRRVYSAAAALDLLTLRDFCTPPS
jgi:hypothetical protein